ncbi:MAG TPA: NAD(P)H-hydrate dehydratase [Burkholderiales bacterium]|nr:NAD(P)H-hydrate dehydratase [Burkholderiales bacterium]
MTRLPHGAPVYRTDEIRRIEVSAASQDEPPQLMERAGLAAAELAREIATDKGTKIAVLAGPGNNGGDALVLARHLKRWWFDVTVTFTGDRARLSADAGAAFDAWRAAGGTVTSELPAASAHALVVDGLFGIGLQRDLAERYAELVGWINDARVPVIALDVPSGIESDSGRILGCAVRAAHTITFIALKPGLLTLEGPEHSGRVHVADLGLDTKALLPPRGSVIGAETLRSVLPKRRWNSHKGSFGSVGIIGGTAGMTGAALLAGRAALKLGAGRVYVGFMSDDAPVIDSVQPELMLRSARDMLGLDHLTCVAVGPGLGQSDDARALLRAAAATSTPLVLDADALNLLATEKGVRFALSSRSAPTLLTPHPAEAARLLGCRTADIQRDRVGAAVRLAKTFKSGVVLKGAGSACAWPDGGWAINTSGNPGMASAGMGDVLTGILAALLSQGAPPQDALVAGVYLHGAAADALTGDDVGPVGLTAGETIDRARRLLNDALR